MHRIERDAAVYDLDNAAHDFPWTAVSKAGAPVEPRRAPKFNWFAGIPRGWGDVIHEYLTQLDALVQRNHWSIHIAQVKEKFGTLRFYVDILDEEGFACHEDSPGDVRQFFKLVREMESATAEVCFDCGTHENVECYGGWIHYACPACEKKLEDARGSRQS